MADNMNEQFASTNTNEQIQIQQTPEQREEASKLCCLTGFKTTGTPTGKETTIAGLKAYYATPSNGDYQGKCILLLSDIFGFVRIFSVL